MFSRDCAGAQPQRGGPDTCRAPHETMSEEVRNQVLYDEKLRVSRSEFILRKLMHSGLQMLVSALRARQDGHQFRVLRNVDIEWREILSRRPFDIVNFSLSCEKNKVGTLKY